jgi:hypothetical protein
MLYLISAILLRFSLYKNKGTGTVCQGQYAPFLVLKIVLPKLEYLTYISTLIQYLLKDLLL